MCTAVAYDVAMGFADGGAAAFEARQEAARRKAAETSEVQRGPSIPPRPSDPPRLSAFDQQIAEARQEALEAEARQAQADAWKSQQETDARARMSALSKEFSQRADALGHPADHVFVTARTERYGSEFAYTFGEVLGEGWLISDQHGHERDYEWRTTAFLVPREGPWLPAFGFQQIHGKGRDLPAETGGKTIIALAATRETIAYVTSTDIWGKDLEGLLAAELVRLERLPGRSAT
jgi:hypothetical protein